MIINILHSFVIKYRTRKDAYLLKKYKKTFFYDEIMKLHNISKGKRCFIIGNGPSLTTDDLNLLISEDCFACNRIYDLFNKTDWRPICYGIQDSRVLDAIVSKNELQNVFDNSKYVFLPFQMRNTFQLFLKNKKLRLFYKRYISIYSKDGYHEEGFIPFSDNMDNGLYDGMSITYGLMQLAVFMGYKEIYLLGIDHNYKMRNGIVESNGSYASGIKPIDMSKQFHPELELCEISFREARRYCESKGIKIYNATRGGKLEVFERINLDSLLKEKEK